MAWVRPTRSRPRRPWPGQKGVAAGNSCGGGGSSLPSGGPRRWGVGARSWGGYTAQQASGLTPGEYLREANRMTMVFAMVETVEALDNLEAIAATPGLDGLFVGPSDLSITLSRGAGVDKTGRETLAAMTRVAAAAKKNGLVAGAFGGSADVIKTYLGLGFTFIAAAVDVDLMQWGAAELNQALAG